MSYRSHFKFREFFVCFALQQLGSEVESKSSRCGSIFLMLKLCYLIQLWGDAEGYLLQALQTLQNIVGHRIVTGQ